MFTQLTFDSTESVEIVKHGPYQLDLFSKPVYQRDGWIDTGYPKLPSHVKRTFKTVHCSHSYVPIEYEEGWMPVGKVTYMVICSRKGADGETILARMIGHSHDGTLEQALVDAFQRLCHRTGESDWSIDEWKQEDFT